MAQKESPGIAKRKKLNQTSSYHSQPTLISSPFSKEGQGLSPAGGGQGWLSPSGGGRGRSNPSKSPSSHSRPDRESTNI